MILAGTTLDPTSIERSLGAGVVVHARDRVDSTNDEVRRLAAGSSAPAVLLVAAAQDAGRGRLGRRWHSPHAGGVYLSLLVRPSAPAAHLARWTLGAGVGVCLALRACGAESVALEWPNDLVARGRKLGGVLAETRTQGADVAELVLGVGVNLAPLGADADPPIAERAIALADLVEPVGMADRGQMASTIARELLSIVERLERGDWHRIAEQWLTLSLDAPGRRVEVRDGHGWRSGVTDGLDPDGALLVRHDDGREVAVRLAGSVRPEGD